MIAQKDIPPILARAHYVTPCGRFRLYEESRTKPSARRSSIDHSGLGDLVFSHNDHDWFHETSSVYLQPHGFLPPGVCFLMRSFLKRDERLSWLSRGALDS